MGDRIVVTLPSLTSSKQAEHLGRMVGVALKGGHQFKLDVQDETGDSLSVSVNR
jgi:hypothetical protein